MANKSPEELFLSRQVCIRQTVLIMAEKLAYLRAGKEFCCSFSQSSSSSASSSTSSSVSSSSSSSSSSSDEGACGCEIGMSTLQVSYTTAGTPGTNFFPNPAIFSRVPTNTEDLPPSFFASHCAYKGAISYFQDDVEYTDVFLFLPKANNTNPDPSYQNLAFLMTKTSSEGIVINTAWTLTPPCYNYLGTHNNEYGLIFPDSRMLTVTVSNPP